MVHLPMWFHQLFTVFAMENQLLVQSLDSSNILHRFGGNFARLFQRFCVAHFLSKLEENVQIYFVTNK
jgi:preprotein translocase subunit SecG